MLIFLSNGNDFMNASLKSDWSVTLKIMIVATLLILLSLLVSDPADILFKSLISQTKIFMWISSLSLTTIFFIQIITVGVS